MSHKRPLSPGREPSIKSAPTETNGKSESDSAETWGVQSAAPSRQCENCSDPHEAMESVKQSNTSIVELHPIQREIWIATSICADSNTKLKHSISLPPLFHPKRLRAAAASNTNVESNVLNSSAVAAIGYSSSCKSWSSQQSSDSCLLMESKAEDPQLAPISASKSTVRFPEEVSPCNGVTANPQFPNEYLPYDGQPKVAAHDSHKQFTCKRVTLNSKRREMLDSLHAALKEPESDSSCDECELEGSISQKEPVDDHPLAEDAEDEAISHSSGDDNTTLIQQETYELHRLMESQLSEITKRKIEYSTRYNDAYYEYRWVELPFKHPFLEIDPTEDIRTRNLTEAEWRLLGIQQSRGWKHFGYAPMEPHILLFRRVIGTNGMTGLAPHKNVLRSNRINRRRSKLAEEIKRKHAQLQEYEKANWRPAWPNFKEKETYTPPPFKALRNKKLTNEKTQKEQLPLFSQLSNPRLWTPLAKVPRWCTNGVLVTVNGVGASGQHHDCEGSIYTTCESDSIGDGYHTIVIVKLLSGEYSGSLEAFPLSNIKPVSPKNCQRRFKKAVFFSANESCGVYGTIKRMLPEKKEILLELGDGCPIAVPVELTYAVTN